VSNHRFTEGRAWLAKCPLSSCESPVIEAHVNGLILRLSTKAIPLKDALIFQKYERIVINVWKGPTQLWATAWHRDQKTVDKGHLYIQHVHGARN
jgi:hypothetical protein